MQETHDFDRTIGAIYEWAAKDGETLVVVTADHETGGLTLVDGDLAEGRIVCKFSTGGHSGRDGAGICFRSRCGGVYRNF